MTLAILIAACTRTQDTNAPTRSTEREDSTNRVASIVQRHDAACAAVVSCIPATAMTISECATRRTQRGLIFGGTTLSDREIDCVARAGSDCVRIARCVGTTPDARACSPGQGSCDGAIARGCHQGLRVETFERCSKGEQCRRCTHRGVCCGTACQHRPTCIDGAPSHCDVDTLTLRRQCDELGMTCAEFPTAVPGCVGPGARCERNLGGRCDGAELVACELGRELRVRCNDLGGRVCVSWIDASGFSHARCDTDNSSCQAGNERCKGPLLWFCDDGEAAEIDCRALGFRDCLAVDRRATCVN
jgi:hypothetical protein